MLKDTIHSWSEVEGPITFEISWYIVEEVSFTRATTQLRVGVTLAHICGDFNRDIACRNPCNFLSTELDQFPTLASVSSANMHIPRTCMLSFQNRKPSSS